MPFDKWTHITVVLKGVIASIYMDGVNVATGKSQIPLNITRTRNFIGKSNWLDQNANSYVKNLRFFNRALNLTEILNNTNS